MPRDSKYTPRNSQCEEVFLQIGFNSNEQDGALRTIEIMGIPGKRLANDDYEVSLRAKHFFDDLIVRPLFVESRRLRNCNFRHLKIWAYHPDIKDNKRGYEIPGLDEHDLKIDSDVSSSGLKNIYVLDNGIKGEEYKQWKQTAEDLFSPLFRKFIVPPKPLEISGDGLLSKLIEGVDSVMSSVDKYGRMKRDLFFDSLIIQID